MKRIALHEPKAGLLSTEDVGEAVAVGQLGVVPQRRQQREKLWIARKEGLGQ